MLFAKRHVPGGTALRAAIAQFDADVPDLVYTRDLLEHFDDWSQGTGRQQAGGEGYVLGLGMSDLDVSIGHAGRGVNTHTATPAANSLYAAAEAFLVPRLPS